MRYTKCPILTHPSKKDNSCMLRMPMFIIFLVISPQPHPGQFLKSFSRQGYVSKEPSSKFGKLGGLQLKSAILVRERRGR